MPWTGFGSGANPSYSASSPRYNLFSDSFYCVKLFATRAIKPVGNKHIIARINALLDQVKRNNSVSISWTPAHTNSDDPLAQGNAEADKLAGRGCAAPDLLTQFQLPALASRSSASAVPLSPRPRWRRRSEVSLARVSSKRTPTPRRDPRLPPFDSRQPLSWRAFFRRLALRFRSFTLPALSVYDYNIGTWWVTNYLVRV